MIRHNWKVKFDFKIILPSIFLFLLTSVWAFSSPIGSSADDGFHLTSIWCAWGEHETCQELQDGAIKLVPDKIAGQPPCYVTWPRADQSAQCIDELPGELVEVTFFNTGSYPPFFHYAMRVFVGPDVNQSVMNMRLFNAILASVVLFFAAYVSPFFIKRSLYLSWGVGLIPVGLFFIPSTNPSSWAIIGIGSFWAFFYSLLYHATNKNKIKLWQSVIGSVISLAIALSSRWDSGVYLLITTFSILLLFLKTEFLKQRKKLLLSILLISIPLATYILLINLRRFGSSFRLPSTQEAPDDQPNAIINLLLEVPSFLVGIFGGQSPDWAQRYGDLGRDFTYGVGWLEFNFPSITGITISLSAFALFFIGLSNIKNMRLLSLTALLISPIVIMIFMRGLFGFAPGSFFQPRYFLPIILVLLGVALINVKKNRLLNKPQAIILGSMIFIGAITAWLATISRYAVSPLASFTNFDQTIAWWPVAVPSNFEKFEFFLLTSLISLLWIIYTILIWSTSKVPTTLKQ